MKTCIPRAIALLILFIFLIPSSFANSIVVRWHEILMQAIRQDTQIHPIKPPVLARSAAIVSTCIYDAWTAYDPIAKPTRPNSPIKVDNPNEGDKEKALSFAAYDCLLDQFPEQQMLFNATMAELGYTLDDQSPPAVVGHKASFAVLIFRHSDGSNQLGDIHPGAYSDYTNYQPINDADNLVDPNRYQPIKFPDGHGGFVVPDFITPQWRFVRPFALMQRDQFLAPPPNLFPGPLYTVQANDILRINRSLTDEQKMITQFWEEELPGSLTAAPQWDLFAKFVSNRDQLSLDEDVQLFFILNNALLDASIACWDTKINYDYIRPISSLRFIFRNTTIRAWGGPCKGSIAIPGSKWFPYRLASQPTPPFAEYTSGHSAFAGAAAEILLLFTRSDKFGYSVTLPQGSSNIEGSAICPRAPVPARDITLTYETFSDAADDDAVSRTYDGVHFEQATLEGVKQGRLVAREVWNKAQRLINGACLGKECEA